MRALLETLATLLLCSFTVSPYLGKVIFIDAITSATPQWVAMAVMTTPLRSIALMLLGRFIIGNFISLRKIESRYTIVFLLYFVCTLE